MSQLITSFHIVLTFVDEDYITSIDFSIVDTVARAGNMRRFRIVLHVIFCSVFAESASSSWSLPKFGISKITIVPTLSTVPKLSSFSDLSYSYNNGDSGFEVGGIHGYPSSNGFSGSYSHQNGYSKPRTYSSQRIKYGNTYHFVYNRTLPLYVSEYLNSGSRYDDLLAGLALYNLSRMSAKGDAYREYNGTDSEICTMNISKPTGEYEETQIDCKLISSFIWEASSPQSTHHVMSSSSTTKEQVNKTYSSNGSDSDNSTLVITVTVKNNTVIDALKAKGPSIEVTPGMTCYMIRLSTDSSVLRRSVECGLLKKYALSSFHRGDPQRLNLAYALLFNLILHIIYVNILK